MIIRKEEQESAILEAPCNGAGHVIVETILNQEKTRGGCKLIAFCSMPEGSACGVHTHTGDSETYIVIEGVAKVIDNGEERILYPGDANFCDDGNTHSIENIGKGYLRYVAIKLFVQEE